MDKFRLNKPVAFMVFNRPDTTRRVFEEIRRARPPRLLVVADGPRPGHPEDGEKCRRVREIIDSVDWDCEVMKNYAEENMGCRMRVSSGLDWVFDTVEEAIILEDDCLPNRSFFRFSDELLERYRNDERVVQVSGFNPLQSRWSCRESYAFSRFGPTWGWATWRWAWNYYDVKMDSWPRARERKLFKSFTFSPAEERWRLKLFDRMHRGEIDTWDFQWSYAKHLNSGLCVVPSVNLVRNIGFGSQATHTTGSPAQESWVRFSADLHFPLDHPDWVLRDPVFEKEYLRQYVGLGKPLPMRVLKRLITIFRRFSPGKGNH